MPSVELTGIHKSFGGVRALDGVDLTVQDGEHVAVLGPSGSGKSTLLRVVAGLEDADAGTVAFSGVRQDGVPAHRRDCAIVFQHFALYPHMTALANVTTGLRFGLGLSRAEADARARELAALMRVEHLLGRRPREMSGGQRQRIALARALARRSGVVLLDEPLSGLDAQLHAALRLEIASLLRGVGATAINVTHDQLDAMAMADRIAVIDDGRIVQVGTPDELYARPASTFVAGFIGSPPMNLLPVDRAGRSAFGGSIAAAEPFVIGVRAEHLTLGPASSAAWTITGNVGLIEPTGADRVVQLLVEGGESVAFRCPIEQTPALGAKVTVAAAPGALTVFGADGQRRGTLAESGLDRKIA